MTTEGHSLHCLWMNVCTNTLALMSWRQQNRQAGVDPLVTVHPSPAWFHLVSGWSSSEIWWMSRLWLRHLSYWMSKPMVPMVSIVNVYYNVNILFSAQTTTQLNTAVLVGPFTFLLSKRLNTAGVSPRLYIRSFSLRLPSQVGLHSNPPQFRSPLCSPVICPAGASSTTLMW